MPSVPRRSLADLSAFGPGDHPDSQVNARVDLRLIATSDLHATLLPYDYCANRVVRGRGLGEIARQIAAERAQAANSLLFDNGDFLQGNALADFVASSSRRRRPHPVITAFNTLGYDAVTLGNHEFNYGLPFLSATLSQARFPVVSANIATRLGRCPLRDRTFVPPFAILRRSVRDREGRMHRLRIGVIGFAPPQIEVWDRDQLAGRIRMRDILAAARAWLPRLRASGADVIVALAHTGIGPIDPEDGMENAATALAALPEIDAVIAGHCHLTFPGAAVPAGPGVDPQRGLLAGKPAVMPGHSGSHLGVIDLVLSKSLAGTRRWTVQAASARVDAMDGARGTPRALLRAIGPDHRAALAWSRQVLGETRVPLHTHFATVAPSAALELVAEAKAAHVRAELVGSAWEGVPVLASVTPYRSGGRGGGGNFTEIAAGPFRMRNVSELYLYPNTLAALEITGAELADWLEVSASIFRQIRPGEIDAPLHDPDRPAFCFEVIPGLSYAIDLSQPARFDAQGRLANPAARRIVGLCHEGRAVTGMDRFVLVTNGHRANRARLEGMARTPILSPGRRVQAVLADHVRARGAVGASPSRNWHFLPMPGTSVVIAAGEGASQYMADVAGYRPRLLGRDDQGFCHYRLHL
ncbi:MAG: bifunctional 2',3'-cyclic-nucleotide 2'-phosphodiesterase/3'-nucleotidase [Paracoccaceae bacterium]|nr:bifunctional 2',3'-cyclic-nucleotide 2'-phosphodiesterase/3'-nucleotidase [Paracoccaceae bacterium]